MHPDPASGRLPAAPLRHGEGIAPPRVEETLPVVLFEDGAGRLVVADSARATVLERSGPLLRIGRARIVLRHLATPVTARLVATGHVVVDGADALNVLLAFAHDGERAPG